MVPTPSDKEYLVVTVNMAGRGSSRKSTENSDNSGAKQEGVRSRSGTIPPIDYSALADQGLGWPSHNLSSKIPSLHILWAKGDVSSYMASTPEEIARQLAEQAWVQQEQSVAMQAQQHPIESLRLKVASLVKELQRKGNPEPIASISKG